MRGAKFQFICNSDNYCSRYDIETRITDEENRKKLFAMWKFVINW